MELYEQVQNYLADHELLKHGDLVVTGVSGGPDSMALLDIMAHLGFRMIVAHLDHNLRPGSSCEADFVAVQARKYGYHFVLETLPGGSLDRSGVSLEEAAREARYKFLWRTALSHGAPYVAVGHTSDDQVETILMHFIRGAGSHGMRGMLPARSMKQWAPDGMRGQVQHPVLVRPLLEVSREQTVRHCRDINVSPFMDESNSDISFFRNRLRHELLPLLETYNNSIRKHVQQTGRIMVEQSTYLEEGVRQALPFVCRNAGHRSWAVYRDRFSEYSDALQRELVRHILTVVLPEEHDITYSVIDRARNSLLTGVPGRTSIIGDIHLIQAGEEAVLCATDAVPCFTQFPQLNVDEVLTDYEQSAGRIPLNSGWRIIYHFGDSVEILRSSLIKKGFHPAEGLFEVADEQVLSLRSRRAGDRILIDTSMHSKKLSDVFIDRHIPEPVRHLWPVLSNDEIILWIPGIRRSCETILSPSHSRVLAVRLDHALSDLHFPDVEGAGTEQKEPGLAASNNLRPDGDSIRIFNSLAGTGNLWDTAVHLGLAPDTIMKPVSDWTSDHGISLFANHDFVTGDPSPRLTAEGLQILRAYLRFVV